MHPEGPDRKDVPVDQAGRARTAAALACLSLVAAAIPPRAQLRRGANIVRRVVAAALVVACLAVLAFYTASGSGSASAYTVTLSGRLMDGSGHPATGINVSAYQGGKGAKCCTWVTAVNTDSTGYYSLPVTSGVYRLQFFPPSSSTLVGHWYSSSGTARLFDQATDVDTTAGGATLSDIDLERGSVISGKVTDSTGGFAIQNVNVSAYVVGACCTWVNGTATGPDGTFSIRVPNGGRYRLQFYPSVASGYIAQWWNGGSGASRFEDAADIAVNADVAGENAVLMSGSKLSGTITDGTSPIAGATVNAYVGGANATCCSWSGTAVTAADGTYTLVVATGKAYRLRFDGPNGAGYITKWGGNGSPVRFEEASDVQVNGNLAGQDAALAIGRQISGKVTDGANAISGVRVNVYAGGSGATCCTWTTFAQTDSNGAYVAIVTSGKYRLSFDGPTTQTYISKWSGGGRRFEDATDVDATSGDATLSMTLQIGYAITGRATDGSGNGVSGVGVGAFTGGSTSRCCTWIAGAGTDANGSYTLIVAAGTYRVGFWPRRESGYMEAWYGGSATGSHFESGADVTVGPAQSSVNVGLTKGTAISGHVTSNGVAGIGGAFVSAFKGGSATCCSWIAGTSTDPGGAYTLLVPSSSTYRIQFSGGPGSSYMTMWYDAGSGTARFESSQDVIVGTTAVALNAQLATGHIVTGTVTDANTGLAIAHVGVGAFVGGASATCCTWVAGAGTQDDGTYQIVIPSGTYRLGFWPPRESNYRSMWYTTGGAAEEDFDRATDIDLTGGTKTISVALSTGVRISGRVTSDGTTPVANVGVSVILGGGVRCCTYIAGSGTDGSGNYTIVAPAGTYRLQFYPPRDSSYIGQWWTSGGGADRYERAQDIAVSSELSGYNAQLATGVTITGRLTDASGAAIAHAGVGAFVGGTGSTCCTWVFGSQTDTNGSYTLAVLPGTYRIQFWPPRGSSAEGAWWSATGPTTEFDVAGDVAATAGATGIDLKLAIGIVISGHVTDGNNKPLPGVGVSVVLGGSVACCTWVNGTGTDQNGYYSIAVSPGVYRMQFFGPRGTSFLNRYWKLAGASSSDFWHSDDININNAPRTIDISLPSGHVITGVVQGASGPIQGAGVDAQICSGWNCMGVAWSGTDATGTYALAVDGTSNANPSGTTYKLHINGPFGGTYIGGWYQSTGSTTSDRDSSTAVTVTTSDVTLATIRLASGLPINGRIVDLNGVGIPGVWVAANTCVGFSCTFVAGAGTSPTGLFSLTAPAGPYKLQVNAPLGSLFVGQWYPGGTAPDNATAVTTGGAPITITLARGNSITGTVKDSRGSPIENVDVSADVCSGSQPTFRCVWAGGTRSGPGGKYTLTIGNGIYKIGFHPPFGSSYMTQYYNNEGRLDQADDVVVNGSDVTDISAALSSGVAINGTVTDGNGNAIANANVGVFTCSGYNCTWIAGNNADATGAYSVIVQPGTYQLRADPPFGSAYVGQWYKIANGVFAGTNDSSQAGTVPVSSSAVTGINFVLPTGNQVKGRVTSNGTTGIPNVNVNANTCDNNNNCSGAGGTRTQPDGTYTLTLVGGNYKIRFDPPFGSNYVNQWYDGANGAANPSGAAIVPVSGTPNTPVANINATLTTGVRISGQVTDAKGVPTQYVWVAAFTCVGKQCTFIAGNGTGPDGSYTIVAPPGAYRVQFHAPQGSSFVDQWYSGVSGGATSSIGGTDVTPPAANINATLASGFRVRGVVRDTNGSPIRNANVTLSPASSCTPWCQAWTAGQNTAVDGSYSVVVPADTYKIQFRGPFGGAYLPQWYGGVNTPGPSTPVTVSADTTLSDVQLAAGFRISGKITDANGVPFTAGSVNALCSDPGCPFSWGMNGTGIQPDGTYTVVVPTGNFVIRYRGADGTPFAYPRYYQSGNAAGTVAMGLGTAVSVTNVDVTGINGSIASGYYIKGKVTSDGATGISGVTLSAQQCVSRNVQYVNSAAAPSAADGTYSVLVPPQGYYKLSFQGPTGSSFLNEFYSSAGPTVATCDLADAIHVNLQDVNANASTLHTGYRIAGTITGPNGPVPSASVGALTGCTSTSTCRAFWATTANDGTYTIVVPDGKTYNVRATAPGGSTLATVWWTSNGQGAGDIEWASPIAISGADFPPVNVTLPTGVLVSGTVMSGSTPVANARVQFVSSCLAGGDECFGARGTFTDASGHYALYVRPNTTFFVHFVPPTGSNAVDDLYNNVHNTFLSNGTPLIVGTSPLVLDQNLLTGSVVSGQVTDTSGMPVPGAEVDLVRMSASSGWSATTSAPASIQGAAAVQLSSGKVLVAGNFVSSPSSSAEIYDPAGRTWTTTGAMTTARGDDAAALLLSGKAIVAGGYDGNTVLSSAELYDPSTGTWSPTGSMSAARRGPVAALLPGGKVLVAGGAGPGGSDLSSAELYDPSTGTWSATAPMSTPRRVPAAARLADGRILVAGGAQGAAGLASAEIYDPASATWSATGSMLTPRLYSAAAPLANGKVLVTGGRSSYATDILSSAEIYDPTTGTWSATSSMSTARLAPSAAPLSAGTVLVIGGAGGGATAEIFDCSCLRYGGSYAGPDGRYWVPVPAGTYKLLVRGYNDLLSDRYYNGKTTEGTADVITVDGTTPLSGINITSLGP